MNYVSVGRTNYFKVKDEAAFREWASKYDLLEVVAQKHTNAFCLLADEGYPTVDPDDDDREVDLQDELAPHLAADQVAVFMETGHEGLRYLIGSAIAVNAKGETCSVSLTDIYTKAANAFKIDAHDINPAEY